VKKGDLKAFGQKKKKTTKKPSKFITFISGVFRFNRPANLTLRTTLTIFVIISLFSLMIVRLWYIQVLDSKAFNALVQANIIRTAIIPPTRGLIFDREGDILVGNKIVEEITVDRSFFTGGNSETKALAALLSMSTKQLVQNASNPNYSNYQPVPVAIDVSQDVVAYLEQHKNMFPGVNVVLTTERTYPYGDLAAQLLGYVGPISSQELKLPQFSSYPSTAIIGQNGIEASYEKYLQGHPGIEKYVVNSRGQVVTSLAQKPPVSGDNVVLSLDLGLEQDLQTALVNQIKIDRGRFDPIHGIYPPAPGGAAVVLDVNTGQVLAMVSYPSYNPSIWVGGISQSQYSQLTSPQSNYPLLNRAIQGLYTPGSVFKLATATAALDYGLIGTGYTYDDATGTFRIPNCSGQCVFHDDDSQAMGTIGIPEAIGASDDVFFYNLGYQFYIRQSQYGPTPIQDIAAKYGLGQITGIDLPGEFEGRVDSPTVRAKDKFLAQGWYAGDQIEMAFGQGGTVITPIQLATAYATFANGGTRYAPFVADTIVRPSGKIVHTNQPKAVDTVSLSSPIKNVLLQGFLDAVYASYGTVGSTGIFDSSFPESSSFPIAGKTGTASVGNNKEPNANFVAFGPAYSPQYVVAVMIEQAGYGATAAAPVALSAFQYLKAHPPGPVVIPKNFPIAQN
jgi:penicillin-binding protein 2